MTWHHELMVDDNGTVWLIEVYCDEQGRGLMYSREQTLTTFGSDPEDPKWGERVREGLLDAARSSAVLATQFARWAADGKLPVPEDKVVTDKAAEEFKNLLEEARKGPQAPWRELFEGGEDD